MRKVLFLLGSFCLALGLSQSARGEGAALQSAAPEVCNAVQQGMVAYEDSKFQRASSEQHDGNPGQSEPHFDVNNDGKLDWVKEVCGGTAHVCGPEITLNDSALPDILPAYDRGELYMSSSENPGYFRLLHDGSRNYMVYFADELRRYPRAVTYLSVHNREYKVCEFAQDVYQTLIPQHIPDYLCESAQYGDLANLAETPLKDEGVKGYSRREAHPVSEVLVDFDNDGEIERLAKFDFASGAGAGCDNTYYMLLDAEGTVVTEGPKAALLERLQANFSLTADPSYPLSCGGNSLRWIQHGQGPRTADHPRYYLEYRGSPRIRRFYFDPENLWRVSAANNGQVTVACLGRTYIETRLVQYDVPPTQ